MYTLHNVTLDNFFLSQLCLKYRLDRLVERREVILFRLTTDIHSTEMHRREQKEVRKKRERMDEGNELRD